MTTTRGVLTTCPVDACPAYSFVAGPYDPGLMWLQHVRDLHPELVYSASEMERRRLTAAMKGRRN